jgi:hypothetical protein
MPLTRVPTIELPKPDAEEPADSGVITNTESDIMLEMLRAQDELKEKSEEAKILKKAEEMNGMSN